MTTRPTHDSTPEDASHSQWMIDVEKFIDELVGNERIPSSPVELVLTSDKNSVKISFRAVDEIGVTEYQIFRGTSRNFSGSGADLIATIPQAVDPATTTIVYSDPETIDKKFYFVRSVKGLRRPKLVGSAVGHGSSFTSEKLSGSNVVLSGSGTPGSMLFINDDRNIAEDNDNFFYHADFKAIVIGEEGLMWGPHVAPDIVLRRDAADTLALRRGTTNQKFRVYERLDSASFPAITHTVLTQGQSESNNTAYGTASIAPSANKLLIATVVGLRLADAANPVPTCAGNGLTWVLVASVPFEHSPGATDRNHMAIFRAMGGSPSSGQVTFTFPQTQARASFSVIEFSNMDTGGSNGADAIVQTVINAESTTTTPSVTLAAFSATGNSTLGITGYAFPETSITPGAGFAEILEQNVPPEGAGHEVEFKVANDTSVDWTYAASVRTRSCAIELKIPTADTKFIELVGLGTSGAAEVMLDNSSGSTRDIALGTRNLGNVRLINAGTEIAEIGTAGLGLSTFNLSFGATFAADDVILLRDGAADTLAQRRGTNAQMFNIYNTWASSTDNELGEIGWIPVANTFVIGTKKGSGAGTARPLSIRTDEIAALNIDTSQNARFLQNLQVDGTVTIGDGDEEDQIAIWNGSAQDYHAGIDDTDDKFYLGLGTVPGTTPGIIIDTGGNVEIVENLQIDKFLNHDGLRIGLFGTAPVVQAGAYTQTYSTAERTLGAYTPDDESSAYSGIDNAQGGSVYATVADLNALRVAYENLRLFGEDVAQMLNAFVDDAQAYGLLQ